MHAAALVAVVAALGCCHAAKTKVFGVGLDSVSGVRNNFFHEIRTMKSKIRIKPTPRAKTLPLHPIFM